MSYGLLSVGGVLSILLGSLMLVESDDPAMQISKSVLIPTLLFSVVVAAGAVYLAGKSSRRRPVSGAEGLIGECGVAKTALTPRGTVMVHGELWSAESDVPIEAGETVVVRALKGLSLHVGRKNQRPA